MPSSSLQQRRCRKKLVLELFQTGLQGLRDLQMLAVSFLSQLIPSLPLRM